MVLLVQSHHVYLTAIVVFFTDMGVCVVTMGFFDDVLIPGGALQPGSKL